MVRVWLRLAAAGAVAGLVAAAVLHAVREDEQAAPAAASPFVAQTAPVLAPARPRPTRGPLRVHAANPRYFADSTGRVVYLTGSHVWWNRVGDRTWRVECEGLPAHRFRFGQYLDRIAALGHNFVRLWAHELTHWRECGDPVRVAQHPWLRTGPGTALDGGPRFDLTRWDESYWRRLRARVEAARKRGLYVSVMLFEGWGVRSRPRPLDWAGHWFNAANNVNGVDGDRDGDGRGLEVHSLEVPEVTRLQEAYVRKTVETVGDLDNVLWEVVNESGPFSTPWQYRMIGLLRRLERDRPLQHPIGMTWHGDNEALWRSDADWISPMDRNHLDDPPLAEGTKVVLSDTDHHCGICFEPLFPWRSFLRGHNPIFMDPFAEDAASRAVRRTLGLTRRLADRIDLEAMRPRRDVASTGYALVAPGREYVVLRPGSGSFTVDLRGAPGLFDAVWIDAWNGAEADGGVVRGGAVRRITPPFGGPAVLLLRTLA